MEFDLMSASFASICGKNSKDSEKREKRMNLISEVRRADNDEISASPESEEPALNSFIVPSAHESFISIVNAKTCANAYGEEIMRSYLTLTRQATFLRGYMY